MTMKREMTVLAVMVLVAACINGSGPTSTDPISVPDPVSVTNTPAPTPEAPPAAEHERGDNPGVVTAKADGQGRVTFYNEGEADHQVYCKYTEPLNEGVQYIPEQRFSVPSGGTFVTPTVQEQFEQFFEKPEASCEPWGWEKEVQLDCGAGQGEHLIGKFYDVSLSVDALPVESLGIVWGEEIFEGERGCYRKGIETFQCSERTEEHTQEVECPCNFEQGVASTPDVEADFNDIEVEAAVQGPGFFELTIFSSKGSDLYYYTKDQDSARLDCNSTDTLKVDYYWRSHGSLFWTIQIRKDGVVVYEATHTKLGWIF